MMGDLIRFPATTERCWDCGRRATRMCGTDNGIAYGCEDCHPHWTRIGADT